MFSFVCIMMDKIAGYDFSSTPINFFDVRLIQPVQATNHSIIIRQQNSKKEPASAKTGLLVKGKCFPVGGLALHQSGEDYLASAIASASEKGMVRPWMWPGTRRYQNPA